MIRAFWHHFKDIHRTKRLQNGDIKVQDAMRVLSRRIADAEFHRTMAGFYTDRVIATDPHTDWWGFADAKQKQHDHQHDCLAEEKRIEEARATVEARKAELAKLREPVQPQSRESETDPAKCKTLCKHCRPDCAYAPQADKP